MKWFRSWLQIGQGRRKSQKVSQQPEVGWFYFPPQLLGPDREYFQNKDKKLVSVPEGEEIFPSNQANLDPGVNSDEDEDIDDIFQVK